MRTERGWAALVLHRAPAVVDLFAGVDFIAALQVRHRATALLRSKRPDNFHGLPITERLNCPLFHCIHLLLYIHTVSYPRCVNNSSGMWQSPYRFLAESLTVMISLYLQT